MTTPLWDKSFCSSRHRCYGVIWLPELRAGESDTGMTTQAVARRWQKNVIKARKLPCHLPVLSAIDGAGLKIDMKFWEQQRAMWWGPFLRIQASVAKQGKAREGCHAAGSRVIHLLQKSVVYCAAMEKQETTGMGKSIKQTSTDNQSKKYERDLNEPSRKNWLPLILCGSLDQEMF